MSEPGAAPIKTHPAVAALAAHLQQNAEGLYLPEAAIRQAREEIEADDREALTHLCAWLGQVYEAAPERCAAVQKSVLALVWDALGAEAAAELEAKTR